MNINLLNKIFDETLNDYNNKKFNDKHYTIFINKNYKDDIRTGIIHQKENINNLKLFFKINTLESILNEEIIDNTIKKFGFSIIKNIGYRKTKDNKFIALYKYVNTLEENGFYFLRNKNISYLEKQHKLEKFFHTLKNLLNKSFFVADLNSNKYLSDTLFKKRFFSERYQNYYDHNLEKLKIVYSKYYNYENSALEKSINQIKRNFNSHNKTIVSYSHGDMHDLNFSYDGIFWDLDTFGNNPCLNDFCIYYWHSLMREDYLIPKYSKWLWNYIKSKNFLKNYNNEKNMKHNYIQNYFNFLFNKFKKNNLEKEFRKEFLSKLFCRIFLVDNILKYSDKDKNKIFTIWNTIYKELFENESNKLINNSCNIIYDK